MIMSGMLYCQITMSDKFRSCAVSSKSRNRVMTRRKRNMQTGLFPFASPVGRDHTAVEKHVLIKFTISTRLFRLVTKLITDGQK